MIIDKNYNSPATSVNIVIEVLNTPTKGNSQNRRFNSGKVYL